LNLTENMTSFLGAYSESITISIIIVAISFIIYYIIKFALGRLADSWKLQRGELKGFIIVLKLVIMISSGTIIIIQFSTVSGTVAAVISLAAGTIVGFASKSTISNTIAGVLILSTRPFQIGDTISAVKDSPIKGRVTDVTIVYTKIKTIKNELITIPNQLLLERHIVNYSRLGTLGIAIEIPAVYNQDRHKIESLLIDSAKTTEDIIKDPHPYVELIRFDTNAAVYELNAFTNKSFDSPSVESEIRKAIYDSFQKHGIDLTVPTVQRKISDEGNTI
jgi:small-conductance mechanosensitive channel